MEEGYVVLCTLYGLCIRERREVAGTATSLTERRVVYSNYGYEILTDIALRVKMLNSMEDYTHACVEYM